MRRRLLGGLVALAALQCGGGFGVARRGRLPLRRSCAVSAEEAALSAATLRFRTAGTADIGDVSELCAEAFSGPFAWWQVLQRTTAVTRFRAVLSRRLRATQQAQRPGEERLLHALIVATQAQEIVGFMEVGLLPSPLRPETDDLGLERRPDAGDALDEALMPLEAAMDAAAPPGAEAASVWQDAVLSAEEKARTPPAKDAVPFLANLVVAPSMRRRGVGRGLVRIGSELVRRRWGMTTIFVAVEKENLAAKLLYEASGFRLVGAGGPVEEEEPPPPTKRYFSADVFYLQKDLEPLPEPLPEPAAEMPTEPTEP